MLSPTPHTVGAGLVDAWRRRLRGLEDRWNAMEPVAAWDVWLTATRQAVAALGLLAGSLASPSLAPLSLASPSMPSPSLVALTIAPSAVAALAPTAWAAQVPPTSGVASAEALTISAVTPDPAASRLTIRGTNFGSRPLVTLDLVPLDVIEVREREVIASAPVAMMPAARYLLTVSRGTAAGESASLRIELGGPATVTGAAPPGRTGAAAVSTDRPSAAAGPSSGAPDPAPASASGNSIPGGTTPAATVGDRVITVDEVDREWRRTDPAGYLAASRRLFDARRRIAHEMVTAELFAREASARGVSVDALLEAELPQRIVSVPDSAVTSLYQAMGERTRGATLDQLRPALRAWLEHITEPELAKMSYAEELMKVSTRAEIALTPPRARVERSAQDASLGPADAAVEMVVFGDFQSVDYARFAQVFGRIRETFGERLRLVFKHLPLQGPISVGAAEAAHCANLQGKFWTFHDAVLAQPAFLDSARLKKFAAEAKLDQRAFDACVDGGESRAAIAQASDEAARYDVRTLPSFLVNGLLAPAPPPFLPPFEYFQRLIEEELALRAKARAGR